MNTPTSEKKETTPRRRTTPYHNKRRSSSGCFAPFKSPSSSSKNTVQNPTPLSKVELAQDVLKLQHEVEEKQKEINELGKLYSEEELQQHIDQLHEYNEIKDVAQMLIGKLAECQGTTTKDLYPTFNLGLED